MSRYNAREVTVAVTAGIAIKIMVEISAIFFGNIAYEISQIVITVNAKKAIGKAYIDSRLVNSIIQAYIDGIAGLTSKKSNRR